MFTESGYRPVEVTQPGPDEQEHSPEPFESRFGDKARIIELMRECPEEHIRSLGKLQDVHPLTTPESTNLVELVELGSQAESSLDSTLAESANHVERLVIEYDGQKLFCVFKPFDGENHEIKFGQGPEKYFPREAAAYLVSEAFGFDLVPPTITRSIRNREGALQLFIDPSEFARWETCYEIVSRSPELQETLEASNDYINMALLDFILANGDRHENNWMLKTEPIASPDAVTLPPPYQSRQLTIQGGNTPTLVGIDHGESLFTRTYKNEQAKGPSIHLTGVDPGEYATGAERDNVVAKEVPIPENQLQLLRQGLERQQEVTQALREVLDIEPQQIFYMWQRAASLIEERTILSNVNREKLNLSSHTFKSLAAQHEHMLDNIKTPIPPAVFDEIQAMSDSLLEEVINTSPLDVSKTPRVRDLVSKEARSLIFQLRHPPLRLTPVNRG